MAEQQRIGEVLVKLLPSDVQGLVVSKEGYTIAVYYGKDSPNNRMIYFSETTWDALVVLCEAFPEMAGHEYFHAKMYHISPETARTQLWRAEEQGRLAAELVSVRTAVKGLRNKLHSFGIDILPVYKAGYVMRRRVRDEEVTTHGRA